MDADQEDVANHRDKSVERATDKNPYNPDSALSEGDVPEVISQGDRDDETIAGSVMAGNALSGSGNIGSLGAAIVGQAAATELVDEEDPNVRTDPDSPD